MSKARDFADIAGAVSGGKIATSDIPDLSTSIITSGSFDAARIPDLAASKITSGSFADARIPDLAATKITSGTIASARLSLSASDIPDLATSKITSGTFADARIAASSVNQHASGGGTIEAYGYYNYTNTQSLSTGTTNVKFYDTGHTIMESDTSIIEKHNTPSTEFTMKSAGRYKISAHFYGGSNAAANNNDDEFLIYLHGYYIRSGTTYIQAARAAMAGQGRIYQSSGNMQSSDRHSHSVYFFFDASANDRFKYVAQGFGSHTSIAINNCSLLIEKYAT
tara:strand:+ start:576 stop:1418 length:843 start_codon:yes stop_codon:yes gene_type:complete